ncbi:MAG: hypothetical protein JST33_03295 [Actinobacteria bacterium]|nr:hypothetical protein [Actinomycetota bacterium]
MTHSAEVSWSLDGTERRAEKRALALDLLREQQARKGTDPFVLEHALQMIGSCSR